MTKKDIEDRLRKEGYGSIREHNDPANVAWPKHDHPGDHILVVIRGSITIEESGKKIFLKVGDEYRAPALSMHSAKIGSEGCEYITGERTT